MFRGSGLARARYLSEATAGLLENSMGFERFWYIVAESRELGSQSVLGRQVLDEWLVCYRGEHGQAVVLQDRCLHRNARLSRGTARQGRLTCPYHGWVYDGTGKVVSMPSQEQEPRGLCARRYATREADGYVYVCLAEGGAAKEPFAMPHCGERGWKSIRLRNRFRNTVSHCVENFIDVPHTAFVHKGIFRASRGEKIVARVTRRAGQVAVIYRNERQNLGTYARFLNPGGSQIEHSDRFFMPNVTCVRYRLGSKRHFIITSQSVPLADDETWVYTDITYNFGLWTGLAAGLVRRQAQKVIDQDIRILGEQMDVIEKYGADFIYSSPDLIHRYVESIRAAIAQGTNPLTLPERSEDVEFWV